MNELLNILMDVNSPPLMSRVSVVRDVDVIWYRIAYCRYYYRLGWYRECELWLPIVSRWRAAAMPGQCFRRYDHRRWRSWRWQSCMQTWPTGSNDKFSIIISYSINNNLFNSIVITKLNLNFTRTLLSFH